ncbi:hypothetical protein [Streptomyces sp. DH37]|uniref:hypothetical protein n=1 Tax=Streptomyces sp. DH37 TaxID=3040122 RepID=UPI0030149AD8
MGAAVRGTAGFDGPLTGTPRTPAPAPPPRAAPAAPTSSPPARAPPRTGPTPRATTTAGRRPARCARPGARPGGGRRPLPRRPPRAGAGRGRLPAGTTGWTEPAPRTEAGGHAANGFPVACGRRFTHLRLRQYPGGVARLRLYGSPTGEGPRRAAARHREPDTGHLAG